jgi:O-antigen ligase
MFGIKLTYILALVALLIFFYRLNRKCSVATYLLSTLYLLPLMNLRVTNEAMGGFTIFDIISFFCLLFFIRECVSISERKHNFYYFILFSLLILFALAGGLFSAFQADSMLTIFKIVPIFIYIRFLSKECSSNLLFFKKVIKALKFGFLLSLAFMLVQLIGGLQFTFYSILGDNTVMPESGLIRYPGFFFDSQLNGQYLSMVSFLFLFKSEQTNNKHALIQYSAFIGGAIAILLAGSRSAFGGFCLGLFIVFLMASQPHRIFIVALTTAGLIFYSIFSPLNGVIDRTNSLTEDYNFRQSIWQEALEISSSHPYLGIGAGNYKSYISRYFQDQYLLLDNEIVYFDHPENGYLKILVEFGSLGFGVFLFLILSPLFTSLLSFINNISDYRISFLIAGILSWIVAFNTVYSIWDYRILIVVATFLVLLNTYPPNKRTVYEAA